MRSILILLFGLLSGAAHAQIRVLASEADDGLLLQVAGQWADSCTPVLDQALLEGDDIVLLAHRDSDKLCQPGKSEFAFELAADSLFIGAPPAGDYPVRLYVRDGRSQAGTLAGFDILQLGDRPSVRPESGMWWAQAGGEFDTAGPGVGFSIEIQGDQTVVMLNGYAPSGQALWLLSTGKLERGLLRGNLTELADGQAFFGPFVKPQAVLTHGRILIQFHDQSHATLWMLGEGSNHFQIQPVSLVRFAFGHNPPLAGRWLVVPETGGSALSLDLAVLESGAGQLVLGDAEGAATLTCGQSASGSAGRCTLRGPQIIDFDNLGLNRWRGTDRSGRRYLAIRLD